MTRAWSGAFLWLLVAATSGCTGAVAAPTAANCIEFDHATTRRGEPVTCRMLWCQETVVSTSGSLHDTGGVAALWCEPLAAPAADAGAGAP